MKYRYNQYCPCGRCRAHGYMGPAVLITLGALFLLSQAGHSHWMDFSFTWPALLIVIGILKLLEHCASISGHVPREYGANLPPNVPQPMPPGTPMYQPQGPITPQPPVAPAGFISSGTGVDNQGGHNG